MTIYYTTGTSTFTTLGTYNPDLLTGLLDGYLIYVGFSFNSITGNVHAGIVIQNKTTNAINYDNMTSGGFAIPSQFMPTSPTYTNMSMMPALNLAQNTGTPNINFYKFLQVSRISNSNAILYGSNVLD